MKSPRHLFSALYAAAWFANLLLTGLAVYLAVQSSAPLMPSAFLALAACILAGNLCPLAVFAVNVWLYRSELEAESLEADLLVRESLQRAEETVSRLDEAEGALAKSVLLARQVPVALEQRLQEWGAYLAQIEDQKWPQVSQQLSLHAADLDWLKDAAAASQASLAQLQDQVGGFTRSDNRTAGLINDLGNQMDELRCGIAELLARPAPAPEPAPEPEPEPAPEPEDILVAEPPIERTVVRQPDLAWEMEAVVAEQAADGPGAVELPARAEVYAHAMIGIANRLYVRGLGGGLAPDKGTEMRLVGIGEYRWESQPLELPLEVEFFINDERPCKQGPVTLQPGQSHHCKLSF